MIDTAAINILRIVSTHSRPKAAASIDKDLSKATIVSTHSRPKAAALGMHPIEWTHAVSTHSRPKAAAPYIKKQEKSAN